MSEFHKTQIGRKFYESDVPRIADALENHVSMQQETLKTLNHIAISLKELTDAVLISQGKKIDPKNKL